MKNNILNKFAINDLKIHYRDTIVTLATLSCLSFILMLITFLSPLLMNSHLLEQQSRYGAYDYISTQYMDRDKIDKMQINLNGKMTSLKEADVSYAIKQSVGYVLPNGSISYIENDSSLIATKIESGRMPIDNQEIAVKKEILENLGYEEDLGEIVSIPYVDENSQCQVQQWKIVGFLENKGSSSVVVGAPSRQGEYILYIDVHNQDEILNSQELQLEKMIDISKDIGNKSQLDFFVTILQFIIFIVCGIILFGLTFASFENRQDDYVLLRGIGATKRQLYYIVFLQAVVFIVLSLVISSILLFIVGSVLKINIDTVIPFSFIPSYYLGNIFTVVLLVMISYFAPARAACQRALTGSFVGNEFQYFYYRYKKLHQMRPFYLGWRQLVNHKKQMIIKIFLIFMASLMMMNMMAEQILSQHFQQKKEHLIQSENNQEISLQFHPIDENKANLNLDDFHIYESYAKEIRYFHTLEHHGYISSTKIYCYDETVKKEFHLQDTIKTGQVVISQGFHNDNNIDLFVMDGENYTIASILEDCNDQFVIMSQEDFKEYGNLQDYQEVKIYFENVQQKTKGLIVFANQNKMLEYIMYDSLALAQEENNAYFEEDIDNVPFVMISIMIGASLIYIYQLSYEILKQRKTIGTYQLIGLKKLEIWSIYAYKSAFIALIGFSLALYYHFADYIMKYVANGGWKMFVLPSGLYHQFIPALLLVIVLIVLSLLPIYTILGKNGMENRNIRE